MMKHDHKSKLDARKKGWNLCEYVVEEVVVMNLRIQILKKNKRRRRRE